jgi:ssDNA-binding replication factor A large subunit
MLNIPISRIIQQITTEKNVPADDVRKRISAKLVEFSGLLSEEGAAHIVANEYGVDLHSMSSIPLKINEIVSQLREITLVAKVIAIYEKRTFSNERGDGVVQSILVGDETGIMRVTFWHSETEKVTCQVGDVLKFIHLSSRQNQNRVELLVGKETTLEKVDVEISLSNAPKKASETEYSKKKLKTCKPNDQVTLLGVIVAINPPYYYMVEKETQKKATGVFDHQVHDYAFVASIVLDDGTDTIRVSAFREQAIELFKVTHEEMLSFRENSELFTHVRTKLLGQHVKISGKVTFNENYNRLEMIAQIVDYDVNATEDVSEYYSL